MGDESWECFMNVELAIQRELAYRRKIFMLQSQEQDGFEKDILPLELLPSRPIVSRSPIANFNSRQSGLSGVKQRASTISAKHLLTQQAQSSISHPKHTNQAEIIFCTICSVPCSGSCSYRQHIDGRKHKTKLEELRFGRNDVVQDSKVANKRRWCKVCNTGCTSEEFFQQHLGSKKHESELEKSKHARKCSKDIKKQPKCCKLCDLWCSSEDHFISHLKGKKHAENKRRAIEKRNCGEKP